MMLVSCWWMLLKLTETTCPYIHFFLLQVEVWLRWLVMAAFVSGRYQTLSTTTAMFPTPSSESSEGLPQLHSSNLLSFCENLLGYIEIWQEQIKFVRRRTFYTLHAARHMQQRQSVAEGRNSVESCLLTWWTSHHLCLLFKLLECTNGTTMIAFSQVSMCCFFTSALRNSASCWCAGCLYQLDKIRLLLMCLLPWIIYWKRSECCLKT